MKTKKVTRRRIKFEVMTEPNSKVFVAGSFNNWDDTAKQLKEQDEKGYFSGSILLLPGEYEYKLVIDGKWQIDSENPNFTQNKLGTLNSVLKVKEA